MSRDIYFGARENKGYILSKLGKGHVWGNDLSVVTSGHWTVEEFVSGYSKGSRFIYIGEATRKFRLMFILDCKIIQPVDDGVNTLNVYIYRNNREIYYKRFPFSGERQIVGDLRVEIANCDSLYMLLAPSLLTNRIQVRPFPSAISDFSGEAYLGGKTPSPKNLFTQKMMPSVGGVMETRTKREEEKPISNVKKGRGRTRLSPAMKAKVVKMVKAGKSAAEIAKALGISAPTVQNIKKSLGLVKKR